MVCRMRSEEEEFGNGIGLASFFQVSSQVFLEDVRNDSLGRGPKVVGASAADTVVGRMPRRNSRRIIHTMMAGLFTVGRG